MSAKQYVLTVIAFALTGCVVTEFEPRGSFFLPPPGSTHTVYIGEAIFESTPAYYMAGGVVASKGIKQELLYSGTSKGSLAVTYREYTMDNLARSAFSQQAQYDYQPAMILNFRGMKAQVMRADNQAIEYVLIKRMKESLSTETMCKSMKQRVTAMGPVAKIVDDEGICNSK